MQKGLKMKMPNYLIILLTSLALQGCSPDSDAKTKLFEEQRSALDKAKTVENTIQQQAQEMQKTVEKQTE